MKFKIKFKKKKTFQSNANFLQYISVEDFQLFGYLVPYVLDQFQAQINPDLIGAICKGIDGAQLHDLVGEIAMLVFFRNIF